MEKYDVIIVGAGTAGLSAAIYVRRAGKTALVLEAETFGGQIINTPEIENYPGIKHVSGFDFALGLYEQATELGAKVVYERVLRIEDTDGGKIVKTSNADYEAKAVILATGAKNKSLGLDHEKEWIGRGVSYCATCDGAFFRNKDVAVVGGGNTALEDALFLSNYCNKVYIIHRRDEFRGDNKELVALKEKANVEFVLNSVTTELKGTDGLEGIVVKNRNTEEEREIAVAGLFVAIGQAPDNNAFADMVDIDNGGYIVAAEDCLTNKAGIFTAGDCRTKKIRQLTTAASDGAIAALAACEYIK